MDTERATHWLLFERAPEAEELQALVVSRELGVTWVDDRTLGWQPGVLLQGPLSAEELAEAEGLPEWVEAVYAADTPRERGKAIPAELQIPGSVLAAFPDGEPSGVERETLETLEAIARRLGGGVLSETGQIVIPEPRIDLLLFSSTWIEEGKLIDLLADLAPMRSDGGPVLPAGIAADGYGLVADLQEGGVLSVTASPVELTPIALAGYDWASGSVYVYEFRHYPTQTFGFAAATEPEAPSDAETRVDAAASVTIEAAATAVFAGSGGPKCGHLCDDDGFLVVLP